MLSGNPISVTTSGNAWTYLVSFSGGTLQATDVPTMSFTGSGGIAAATVVTTIEGGQGLEETSQMMGIQKTGAGNLVLGGPNGYSGNTVIWGGYVTARNSNSFGVGTANVYVEPWQGGPTNPPYAQIRLDGSLGNLNIPNRGLSLQDNLIAANNYVPSENNLADFSGWLDNLAGANTWTNNESSEQQEINFNTTTAPTGSFTISQGPQSQKGGQQVTASITTTGSTAVASRRRHPDGAR